MSKHMTDKQVRRVQVEKLQGSKNDYTKHDRRYVRPLKEKITGIQRTNRGYKEIKHQVINVGFERQM